MCPVPTLWSARRSLLLGAALAALAGVACGKKAPPQAPPPPRVPPKPVPPPGPPPLDTSGLPTEPSLRAMLLGLRVLEKQPFLGLVDTWSLYRMTQLRRDLLTPMVPNNIALVLTTQDPASRLFNGRAKAYPLPKDPGRGAHKLIIYKMAPFGDPPASLKYLRTFLTAPLAGHAQVAQLQTLAWAMEQPTKLPPALTAQKTRLVNRIAAEQKADHAFSDLFASRACLLMLLGKPPRDEMRRWSDVITKAQSPIDGFWHSGSSEPAVTFDGETFPAYAGPVHTTVSAVVALALIQAPAKP